MSRGLRAFGGRTLNQIDPLLGKSMRPIDCIKHFFDCKKPALKVQNLD